MSIHAADRLAIAFCNEAAGASRPSHGRPSSVFKHLTGFTLNGTHLDYKSNEKFVLTRGDRKTMMEQITENGPMDHKSGRKILMVGKDAVFSRKIIDHCVHLAERLRYGLVALNVDTRLVGNRFERLAAGAAKELRAEAGARGLQCDQLVRAGDLDHVIQDTIHEIRRVELVVVDLKEEDEEVRGLTVPVISVVSGSTSKGGRMTAQKESSKAGIIARTAGLGALSAAFCAAVFTHSDTVMQYCIRGGWYAALPLATVIAFSFVHGAFAHNLWSLLGIEAYKRDRVRETERKVIEKRKQLRKRPRMYAYVNPFHRVDR